MRFNRRTRQFVTMTFILNQFLMLPVYMFIPSLAFSQGKNNLYGFIFFIINILYYLPIPVTGVNIHLINTIVSSICVFYTMLGGIKAVVWTDVVQAGVMLLSVVMVGVLGTMRTGGLSAVIENASAGGRFNFE